MRQLDVTRTALALSVANAETVLLVTMPTTGFGRDQNVLSLMDASLGEHPSLPLTTTGSVTLVAQTIDDLDAMRTFVQELRSNAMHRPGGLFTATMFSGGRVVEHVAGMAVAFPLGIEPEIAAWRREVAALAA